MTSTLLPTPLNPVYSPKTVSAGALQQMLYAQSAGGAKTAAPQQRGISDGIVFDTDVSNPSLNPVAGTCRIMIPSYNTSIVFGPIAYAGMTAPPNGTACVVGTIAPGPQQVTDSSQVRILSYTGWTPNSPTGPTGATGAASTVTGPTGLTGPTGSPPGTVSGRIYQNTASSVGTSATQLTGFLSGYTNGGIVATTTSLTVPISGIYNVSAAWQCSAAYAANYYVYVYKNGSTVALVSSFYNAQAGHEITIGLSDNISCTAGDVISIWGASPSGAQTTTAGSDATWLSVSLQGGQGPTGPSGGPTGPTGIGVTGPVGPHAAGAVLSVYSTSGFTGSGANAIVSYNTVIVDSAAGWNGSNTYTVQQTGTYVITALTSGTSTASGQFGNTLIYVSGSLAIRGSATLSTAASDVLVSVAAGSLQLTAGQTVSCYQQWTSGLASLTGQPDFYLNIVEASGSGPTGPSGGPTGPTGVTGSSGPTGPSTLAGNPVAVASGTGTTSVANNTAVAISVSSLSTNIGGFTISSGKVIVPKAGTYMVAPHLTMTSISGAGAILSVFVYQNSSTLGSANVILGSVSQNVTIQGTILVTCALGDQLGIGAYHNTGSTETANNASSSIDIYLISD